MGEICPLLTELLRYSQIYKKASFFIAKTSFFNHLAMRTKTCKNSSWDQRSTPPLLVTLKPLLLVSSLHLEQCGVGGGDHQDGGGGKCGLGYFPNATRTFPSSPPSGVKAEVAALSLGDWRRRRRPVPGWQRKWWKQPKKVGSYYSHATWEKQQVLYPNLFR